MKPLHDLPPDCRNVGDFLGTVCGVDVYKEARFGALTSDYILVVESSVDSWDYLYPSGYLGATLRDKITPAQIESIRAYINLLS